MGASGPDPNDPTTLPAPVPDMLERPDRSIERIEGVRIGFDERYAVRDVEAQVAAAVVAAVEMLEGLGAHLVEVRLPDVGETSYRLQRFTVPFDFNGAPTLTLPCGKSSEGLPLSLQLASKPLGEPLLCRLGAAYEAATEWHNLHPDLAACKVTSTRGALPPATGVHIAPRPRQGRRGLGARRLLRRRARKVAWA